MININDIQKRLLVNPEPKQVKEIRNLILSSFKDLEFFEIPHKYFLHNQDGTQTELPSVSGVIHQFEPPKDWDKIRINKANREGLDPEVLKREWRENNLRSTSNGSKTHLFLENLMKLWIYGEESLDQEVSHYQYEDGFLIPYGSKEAAGIKFYEEMVLAKPDIYPIMPEAKIYTGLSPEFSFKQEYCGTFDLLFGKRDPKTGEILPFLADWKGLALDTKILTTEGWKTMGTLSEHDTVYDKNGKPTKILHLSEIHHNPCCRIKFDDGYSIVADIDHRWLIEVPQGSTGTIEVVMTTLEMVNIIITSKVGHELRIKDPSRDTDLPVQRTPKGYRVITSIESVPTVPTRCIEVDSETHTYLATEKLIVTHNTNKSLTNDYARKKHQMMLPPFQDMVDEPLSHYTLQLSCYQMGIQQLGLPVTHRIIVWLKEDGTYDLIPVPDVTDRLKLIL